MARNTGKDGGTEGGQGRKESGSVKRERKLKVLAKKRKREEGGERRDVLKWKREISCKKRKKGIDCWVRKGSRQQREERRKIMNSEIKDNKISS